MSHRYIITNIENANRDGISVELAFPDNIKKKLKLSALELAKIADPTHEFPGKKIPPSVDQTEEGEKS